jgi:hypothetical protein
VSSAAPPAEDDPQPEPEPPGPLGRALGVVLLPFVVVWDGMKALEDRLAPLASRFRAALRVRGERVLRFLDRLTRAPAVAFNRTMELVLRPLDWTGRQVGRATEAGLRPVVAVVTAPARAVQRVWRATTALVRRAASATWRATKRVLDAMARPWRSIGRAARTQWRAMVARVRGNTGRR